MPERDFAMSRQQFLNAVGTGTSMVVLPVDAWSTFEGQGLELNHIRASRGAVLQVHEWDRWICMGAIDRYAIETAGPVIQAASGQIWELNASVHRVPNEADAIEWLHGDWSFGFTTEDFHIDFDGVVTEEPHTFPIEDDLFGQEFSIRLIGEPKFSLIR